MIRILATALILAPSIAWAEDAPPPPDIPPWLPLLRALVDDPSVPCVRIPSLTMQGGEKMEGLVCHWRLTLKQLARLREGYNALHVQLQTGRSWRHP